MSTAQIPALDMNKLNAFVGQFVADLGATVHTGMVVIGEKLGLYKALAGDPMSSTQLATKTKTDERYLREWLASQAAGGYITYDEKDDKFSLNEVSRIESSARAQVPHPASAPPSLRPMAAVDAALDGQRLEAEACENVCGADIPWIRNYEGTRTVVKLPLALVVSSCEPAPGSAGFGRSVSLCLPPSPGIVGSGRFPARRRRIPDREASR